MSDDTDETVVDQATVDLKAARDFIAWAHSLGATAIKLGNIEVVFKAEPERTIGFAMPTDPHGWDFE